MLVADWRKITLSCVKNKAQVYTIRPNNIAQVRTIVWQKWTK